MAKLLNLYYCAILTFVLENPNITLDDIKTLLIKNIKSTPEKIYKTIDGNFSEYQTSKMSVCLSHYEAINSCIDNLEQYILKLAIHYRTEINLLLTIPSIKEYKRNFSNIYYSRNWYRYERIFRF